MLHPFSEKAFLEFVKKQPPEKKYDYFDPYYCALAQYGKSLGLRVKAGGSNFAIYENDYLRKYVTILDEHPYAAGEPPWTFGALRKRLEQGG